jgi:hypothetical protein
LQDICCVRAAARWIVRLAPRISSKRKLLAPETCKNEV